MQRDTLLVVSILFSNMPLGQIFRYRCQHTVSLYLIFILLLVSYQVRYQEMMLILVSATCSSYMGLPFSHRISQLHCSAASRRILIQ